MTQSLTDLLGASATATGTTITIDLTDFKDGNNVQLLDDPTNATDQKKVATLINGIWLNSKQSVDADGNVVVDKTNGIVSQDSFQEKTFETRQDETQIKHERIFALYTSDNSSFDPDNIV